MSKRRKNDFGDGLRKKVKKCGIGSCYEKEKEINKCMFKRDLRQTIVRTIFEPEKNADGGISQRPLVSSFYYYPLFQDNRNMTNARKLHDFMIEYNITAYNGR